MQYLLYIYHYVKEWRKNPKCSLSCCLALLLPFRQLQGEIRGFAGSKPLKQQLKTGKIEMQSIASTSRESGAVNVTLEDYNEEREQEDTTTDEKSIEQGVQTIAKAIIHEIPRETYDTKLQGEIRGLTGRKLLTEQQLKTGKIEMQSIASTSRESGAVNVTLEDYNEEREQEDTTTDEKNIEQGVQTIAKAIIHEIPRETYDTKLQGEIRGLTGRKLLTEQQLKTGKIEMQSIASTSRESGAVNVTLEDYNEEREQGDTTTDEKSIEQGVQAIAKAIIHEIPRETYDTKL